MYLNMNSVTFVGCIVHLWTFLCKSELGQNADCVGSCFECNIYIYIYLVFVSEC